MQTANAVLVCFIPVEISDMKCLCRRRLTCHQLLVRIVLAKTASPDRKMEQFCASRKPTASSIDEFEAIKRFGTPGAQAVRRKPPAMLDKMFQTEDSRPFGTRFREPPNRSWNCKRKNTTLISVTVAHIGDAVTSTFRS